MGSTACGSARMPDGGFAEAAGRAAALTADGATAPFDGEAEETDTVREAALPRAAPFFRDVTRCGFFPIARTPGSGLPRSRRWGAIRGRGLTSTINCERQRLPQSLPQKGRAYP